MFASDGALRTPGRPPTPGLKATVSLNALDGRWQEAQDIVLSLDMTGSKNSFLPSAQRAGVSSLPSGNTGSGKPGGTASKGAGPTKTGSAGSFRHEKTSSVQHKSIPAFFIPLLGDHQFFNCDRPLVLP